MKCLCSFATGLQYVCPENVFSKQQTTSVNRIFQLYIVVKKFLHFGHFNNVNFRLIITRMIFVCCERFIRHVDFETNLLGFVFHFEFVDKKKL